VEERDNGLETKLKALSQQWRDRAKEFQEHGCDDVAATYTKTTQELEAVVADWEGEQLTTAEAARETGYSEEHLRRLVRDGKLPAARADGSKSQLRLRRGDLPRKPTGTNHKGGNNRPDDTYDPEEDARSIARHIRR
jgi:excisionase family DNA binding protein